MTKRETALFGIGFIIVNVLVIVTLSQNRLEIGFSMLGITGGLAMLVSAYFKRKDK